MICGMEIPLFIVRVGPYHLRVQILFQRTSGRTAVIAGLADKIGRGIPEEIVFVEGSWTPQVVFRLQLAALCAAACGIGVGRNIR